MVQIIQDAIATGVSQKQACAILGLAPRKFRRWAQPKPLLPRTAWNKLLPAERDAIINTAATPDFWGKPPSHIFVHGQESGQFAVSLATVYRALKTQRWIRPRRHTKRSSYVGIHTLLEQGFSLLCYDATAFKTEAGIPVWALPVIVLPSRYLLSIGYSLQSVTATDLQRTLTAALALVPETFTANLIAHSDRGSQMKATKIKRLINDLLHAPVHFGRPQTPDDEAWIEAFIKTLKYHRDRPDSFPLADDVIRWLQRFPELYNNEPHSALNYVTPAQALAGRKEAILAQRKRNLLVARTLRYATWKFNQKRTLQVPQK